MVFNNRSFSQRDIENIRTVANEPKWQDVTKTGLFGLGFNSCYCITDVSACVGACVGACACLVWVACLGVLRLGVRV